MHWRMVSAALLAMIGGASVAATDPALRIENAAARIIVIPEARGDVAYTIAPGRAALPPLKIRRDGAALVLDGGLGGGFGPFGLHTALSCQGSGDRARVRVPGRGEIPIQDLPLITAHVPRSPRISAGPAVFGQVGATDALDLSLSGCGDWRVGDVKGPMRLAVAGSGDVRGGSAAAATVVIAGTSDVYLAGLGALDARIAGAGDLHAAAVNGPMTAKITGSGNIAVDGGHAPNLSATIVGSGDVRYRGTAGVLTAFIAGAGDVDVGHVTGAVNKRVVGSGDVNFGR